MNNADEREVLFNSLVKDEHFLFLFDLLKTTKEQDNLYYEETQEDPEHIFVIEDKITDYIMEKCKLYLDEYDLLLSKNNLTYDSPSELKEKVKNENGFDSNYASRDFFEDLLCNYARGNNEFSKEQIIKQLIYWDENIIMGDDTEWIEFHFKEPRYKMFNFSIDKSK